MTPLDTPAAVAPAVTASVAGLATTPAASTAALINVMLCRITYPSGPSIA